MMLVKIQMIQMTIKGMWVNKDSHSFPPDTSFALFPPKDNAIIRPLRRDGRVAEGAPLLREYGVYSSHRGFESLPLRQLECVISMRP